MVFDANCKINIGLDILNRRDDGFHDLSTIMYPAKGVYDVVEVVYSDKFKFSSSGLLLDCDSDKNLCVKAYNLLKKECGGDIAPLHIHLHKVVPFGAGLGGGSSDATFTLIAINELLGLKLSKERVKELASMLGSDTAFFVENTPQLCTSRGEITFPIDIDLSGLYLTIVKPELFISTKEAFSGVVPSAAKFDLVDLPKINIRRWRDVVKNDFEKHLFISHPELDLIKREFYQKGAIYASMSGSGSALYSLSESKLDCADLCKDWFSVSYVIK